MRLTMFDGYFDATTIHGFSYMKSDNSIITRLFWVTIVITGLAISGSLISQLVSDWDNNPTIITLGSVQAPISDIQFPTITLCENPDGPIQNWVYPEKILNALAFECWKPKWYYAEYGIDPPYPACNGTAKQFREDFRGGIKLILDYFVSAYESGNRDFIPEFTWIWTYEWDTVMNIIGNKTDVTEFIAYFDNAVLDSFAYSTSFEEFLSDLENTKDTDGSRANPNNEEWKKLMAHLTAAKIMLSEDNEKELPFGLLLTMFENILLPGPSDKQCDMHSVEQSIHRVLATFTKTLGFNTSSEVSLYDIPPMLSYFSEDRFATSHVLQERFRFTLCNIENVTGNFYDYEAFTKCNRKWEQRALNSSQAHPCDCDEVDMDGLCCNGFSNLLGQDFPRIMHVMKMASKAAKSYFDKDALLEPFWNSSHFKYHLNSMKKGYYFNENRQPATFESTASVQGCSYYGMPNDTVDKSYNCKLFKPTVTDLGICHSFNGHTLNDILQPSFFKETIIGEYTAETEVYKPTNILNGVGSGRLFGMKLKLYNRPLMKYPRVKPKIWGKTRKRFVPWTSFSLGISSTNEIYQMRATGLTPRMGHKTTYKVFPEELVAAESLQGVPIEKRNCLFEDEGKGYIEFFANYSQAACQFECLAKMATSICRCTPWDTPFMHDEVGHIVCDIFGRTCYDLVMKQQYRSQGCNCPPDCRNIQYTVFTKEETIDPLAYCHEDSDTYTTITFGSLFDKVFNDIFYANYNLEHGLKAFEVNLGSYFRKNAFTSLMCEHYVNRSIAEVHITFGSGRYTKTIMDKRVTFSDQLGSLGGTLGLFTGMSILSMVEAIYWIIRMARNCLAPPKRH